MANFIININEKIVTPYSYKNTLIQRDENCNGDTFTESIKLSKNDTLIDSFMYLIQSYTGNPVKKLYIKDIIYSDSVKYYMEYNSIQMLPNTEYEIDITGLSSTDIIPNLFIKGNQPEKEYTNQSILFKVAIEDTLNKKHEYVNSSTTVTYKECPVNSSFEVTEEDYSYSPCGAGSESVRFKLEGPANTPVTIKYQTITSGNNGIDEGSLYRLDSDNQTIINTEIPNFSPTTAIYTHIINTNLTGIYNLRADLCANPSSSNLQSNYVEVKIDIFNPSNGLLISSYTISAEQFI